jgi:hypothetical protein
MLFFSGRRHDAAVAAEHDLYEKLETLSTFPQHQFRGCFGGDSAYPVYWPIIPLHGPALTQQQVTIFEVSLRGPGRRDFPRSIRVSGTNVANRSSK